MAGRKRSSVSGTKTVVSVGLTPEQLAFLDGMNKESRGKALSDLVCRVMSEGLKVCSSVGSPTSVGGKVEMKVRQLDVRPSSTIDGYVPRLGVGEPPVAKNGHQMCGKCFRMKMFTCVVCEKAFGGVFPLLD